MKKMVLVEVTKAYELQAERPSAERPTKSDFISEKISYCLKSPKIGAKSPKFNLKRHQKDINFRWLSMCF